MARSTSADPMVGDTIITPDGNLSIVRSIDPLIDYVELANGDGYPMESLDLVPRPEEPERLSDWLEGPTYRIREAKEIGEVVTNRCLDYCRCAHCYVQFAKFVDAAEMKRQHFIDNAVCQCEANGCSCLA